VAIDTSAPESPLERSRPFDPKWLIVAAAVVIAVVGGVLAWDWRHLDQKFPAGYGIGVRRPVGDTVWTSLIPPDHEGVDRVTITDLEPAVRTDGARVEVEYLLCELDEDYLAAQKVGGFGYGGHDPDVDRYCSSTKPALGATFELRADPPQEVIVGITATRPGRTFITGHKIHFEDGWRVGEDEIGVETRLTAPATD
jgi:hypothetical protein